MTARIRLNGCPQFMTTGEVAKVLRRAESTIRRYAAEGLLPKYETAGKQTTLYLRSDVAKLIQPKAT